MPQGRTNTIVKAALLHDCGGVKINRAGDMDEDETMRDAVRVNTREILKNDKELDESILRAIEHMQTLEMDNASKDAVEAARANSRATILHVANAYDQMTAMKSYEEPTSEVKALRVLLDNPDKYDPVAVQALINGINVLNPGVCVELTNHVKGVVIIENETDIFKPWVLSFRDNQLHDLSNSSEGDLQLIDIMKTMDNRIKLDPDILKEYSAV